MAGLLAYEAKRRPEIQALLDRVNELTDDEIENAVVPLPWFRTALYQVRQQAIDARRMVDILANAKDSFVEDPIGTMGIFNLDTQFVKTSASSSIEVKYGFPLWFPLVGGGVWIDTVFAKNIPESLQGILHTIPMTKMEYKKVLNDRRSKLI